MAEHGLIVTEDEFLGTYHNGLEYARRYRRVRELRATGHGHEEIFRATGYPRGTISRWMNNRCKPDSLRGLEIAERLGIVPLTQESKMFYPLNRLLGWIKERGYFTHYEPSMTGSRQGLEGLEREFDGSGIGFVYFESNGSLRIKEEPVIYGRVLFCMRERELSKRD